MLNNISNNFVCLVNMLWHITISMTGSMMFSSLLNLDESMPVFYEKWNHFQYVVLGNQRARSTSKINWKLFVLFDNVKFINKNNKIPHFILKKIVTTQRSQSWQVFIMRFLRLLPWQMQLMSRPLQKCLHHLQVAKMINEYWFQILLVFIQFWQSYANYSKRVQFLLRHSVFVILPWHIS